MRKAIIVPSAHMVINRIEDNNRLMTEAMVREFGFEMVVMDNIDVDVIKKYDLVFLNHFHYLRKENIENTFRMLELPIKVLAYGADMDVLVKRIKRVLPGKYSSVVTYVDAVNQFYLRSDKILCDVYEYFKTICAENYDKIKDKMVWWPKAVWAYDRYFNMPFNENPIPKCTLAGKLDDRYPLREYVYKNIAKRVVFYSHPGYGTIDPNKYPIGDAFAKELNKYVCGVCPAKHVGHVLEKYLIIPASGSLLLAERTPDFDRLGMEDGKHYVGVTRKNVVSVIKCVCKHSAAYRDIRLAGREFVRQNHIGKSRIEVLRGVLKDMGDNIK